MKAMRFGFWYIGIAGYSFGISERFSAAIADSILSAKDLILLFTALFFASIWLLMIPKDID